MRSHEFITEALTNPYNFDTFNTDVSMIRKNAVGRRKDRKAMTATFYTSEGDKYKIWAYKIGMTKKERDQIKDYEKSAAHDEFAPFHFFEDTGGIWEVHFSLIRVEWDKSEYADNRITGTGDAFRVFATVFKFIEKFAQTKEPTIISIKSKIEEAHRGDLYKKMATRYAGQIGYQVTSERKVGDKYRLELRKK